MLFIEIENPAINCHEFAINTGDFAINTGHINGQSPLIRAILMAVAINTARINGRAAVLMAVAINTGARRTWVLAHRSITRGSYGSTGSPPWRSARPWGSRARFCHCSQPRGLSGEKVVLNKKKGTS